MSDTPDAGIAAQILRELVESKLITADQARALRDRLADGDIKAADWIALADFQERA